LSSVWDRKERRKLNEDVVFHGVEKGRAVWDGVKTTHKIERTVPAPNKKNPLRDDKRGGLEFRGGGKKGLGQKAKAPEGQCQGDVATSNGKE